MRKFILLTVAALAAAGALAAVGLAISRGQAGPPPGLATISNGGVSGVALGASQRGQLAAANVTDDVRLLGEAGGHRLFRGHSADGQPCFMTSRAEVAPAEFGVIACLADAVSFPSARMPILDLSPLVREPGAALPRVNALVGFAADGVGSVGIVDDTGRSHVVRVRANTYAATGLSGIPASAIAAFDRTGREIYRQPLTLQ